MSSEAGGVASSLPRAIISEHLLREAARRALADGARTSGIAHGHIVDLRADAYGHGAAEVARIVAEVGARRALVDAAQTELVANAGLDPAPAGAATVDPRTLYGFPGSGTDPSVRLVGRVLSTKPLRAGEGVSYGYTYRAERDTVVALVTGGYAQGIVRALGNRASAEIAGTLRPIVGRVAMDVCVIDLGGSQDADAVLEGAEVTFFGGAGPAANQLATWQDATGLGAGELMAVAVGRAVREWTS